jgi:hypothetical protein
MLLHGSEELDANLGDWSKKNLHGLVIEHSLSIYKAPVAFNSLIFIYNRLHRHQMGSESLKKKIIWG